MDNFSKEFNVALDLHVQVKHYSPARSAPPCSNPDSPAFSDCGDDVELEFILYFLNKDGIAKEIPDELDFLYDKLFDEILEHYESSLDSDYLD